MGVFVQDVSSQLLTRVRAHGQPVARPALMVSSLVLTDLTALCVAGGLSVLGRYLFGGQFTFWLYFDMWPLLLSFPVSFAAIDLYDEVGISPPEELRRTTMAMSLVYLVIGAGTFLLRGAEDYSRAVFLVAWMLSLVFVPIARHTVRNNLCRRPWWGRPAVAIVKGRRGELVLSSLLSQASLGLKIIGVVTDDKSTAHSICGIPVIGDLTSLPSVSSSTGVRHGIIAMPAASRRRLADVVEACRQLLANVIVIPEWFDPSRPWVASRDINGVPGLALRQELLLPGPRLIKRCLDIIGTIVLSCVFTPLLVVTALSVVICSPGKVFYGHRRVGQGGRRFNAWKFRTMVRDGDRMLQRCLAESPALRKEWEQAHKLRNDPRVIRVGHFLRRSSFDELPQLWNVLRGEMSLVGPRPIVDDEIRRYGEHFDLYKAVRPGITGLWQVSGRNDTTYAERTNLDRYYVRNWSVWLDLYILARTVRAMLLGRGAY